MLLALADDLGSQGSDGALFQEGVVVLLDIKFLLDLIDSLDSNIACSLESVGNLKWVNTFV